MTTHAEWLDRVAKELSDFSQFAPFGEGNPPSRCRDWLEAKLATRPSPTRAEVERAVATYGQASYDLGQWDASNGGSGFVADHSRNAARTALLALLTEPVGEVYTVEDEPNVGGPLVYLPHPAYLNGTRVRVSPVKEEK